MFDKLMKLFEGTGVILRAVFFTGSLLLMTVYITYPALFQKSRENPGSGGEDVEIVFSASVQESDSLSAAREDGLENTPGKGIGK